MILFILVILGFAFYVMSREERGRFIRAALVVVRRWKDVATQHWPEREPYRDALQTRTRWALVTPALVGLNVAIFVCMLFGAGALSDPETLVAWGGNFGPRTTNGEWWRLVTATFVHSGMLQLLVNVAGLVQVGLVLERLVGHCAFAAVYVAAGVLASLVSLATHPVIVSVGASGAIFGAYGLLLASLIWNMRHRSPVTIPLTAVKSLGPAAAVFVLYNVATDSPERAAELTGLAVGLISGLVLTRGVSARKPPARRIAAVMAAAVAIAVASAIPLRGLIDVRPEIARVVAVEDRTASAYETAVDAFRNGRITADALAQLIDRTIMPELRAVRVRLNALDRVPGEHQPLVASAEEYFRLRNESWRLRSEALHKGNMPKLREADRTERASLTAFQMIKPHDQK
jgi:rhomboid protease GluP